MVISILSYFLVAVIFNVKSAVIQVCSQFVVLIYMSTLFGSIKSPLFPFRDISESSTLNSQGTKSHNIQKGLAFAFFFKIGNKRFYE